MFKVMIEETREDGVYKQAVFICADLGECIAESLMMARVCRGECDVLAKIVRYILEGQGDLEEYYPGYNDALNRMCQAACDVISGWEKHDE